MRKRAVIPGGLGALAFAGCATTTVKTTAASAPAPSSARPYGLGRPLQGLPAGLSGRTLLAGVCLAGERLRLTPR